MHIFDYSFLDNGLLPSNLINLTSNIASLKTMAGVRKEEFAKVFTELEAVAKVQSVKSSNAIEGIVTSDERIAAIVNQDSAPMNHTEGEIAGYRDALNAIHLHHEMVAGDLPRHAPRNISVESVVRCRHHFDGVALLYYLARFHKCQDGAAALCVRARSNRDDNVVTF